MMRVGIYTGNLYSQEDYEKGRINECAIVVSPSDGKDGIEKTKTIAQLKRITNCSQCHGCLEGGNHVRHHS